jgi:hypothetical protein
MRSSSQCASRSAGNWSEASMQPMRETGQAALSANWPNAEGRAAANRNGATARAHEATRQLGRPVSHRPSDDSAIQNALPARTSVHEGECVHRTKRAAIVPGMSADWPAGAAGVAWNVKTPRPRALEQPGPRCGYCHPLFRCGVGVGQGKTPRPQLVTEVAV